MENDILIPKVDNNLLHKSIKKKINEIANVLATQNSGDLGLLSGYSGKILFQAYYNRFVLNKDNEDIIDMLEFLFKQIENRTLSNTFCGGIAGISWLISFLSEEGYIEADTDDILNDVDERLFKSMMNDISCSNYDFLHGGIGVALYFLRRKGMQQREYVKRFVDELQNKAIYDRVRRHIKWESIVNLEEKTKGYNFSLSHGIACIIAFLAKVYEQNISREQVLDMLSMSINYLLDSQLPFDRYNCCFPSWVQKGKNGIPSRLAWCYGDLGISSALNLVAIKTKNGILTEVIRGILLKNAYRLDLIKENVKDACFCHGTAGIAHMYNKFAVRYGDELFHQVRDYWLLKTIELARFSDGYAGYKLFLGNKWVNENSLLEGISGIGLVLLAYEYEVGCNWDECFLLS